MANHDSRKRAAGRKPVGKRALSLLMALVMSLSLVQISAFAADGSGLTKEQVLRLREEFAIYAVASGRINVAGMTPDNMAPLCEAIVAVL